MVGLLGRLVITAAVYPFLHALYLAYEFIFKFICNKYSIQKGYLQFILPWATIVIAICAYDITSIPLAIFTSVTITLFYHLGEGPIKK